MQPRSNTHAAVEVLLVDDDAGDVRLTLELLAAAKVRNHIRVARDGLEALEVLRSPTGGPRPDLILLDLNMPRMDGHEFLREVKADPALRDIPVVIMTTSDRDRVLLERYQLSAAAYVTKPVGLERFSEVVRSISDFWFEVVRLPRKGAA